MIRFLIFWTLFLMAPGYIVTSLLLKRGKLDFIERIPLSFCVSLFVLTVPILFSYIFQIKLNSIIFVFAVILTGLVALWLVKYLISAKKGVSFSSDCRERSGPESSDRGWTILLCISMVLLGFFAYKFSGKSFTRDIGDTWFFLSFVKKMIVQGKAVPFNPFINGETSEFIYGYNLWTLLLALLTKFSKINIMQAWAYSIPLLGILMTSSVYSLAKVLFNKRVAVISAFLHMGLLFSYGNLRVVINSPRPPTVSIFILSITALAVLLWYIREGKWQFLSLSGGLIAITAFIHLSDGLGIIIILFIFILFSKLWNEKKIITRRMLDVIAVSGILLGVFIGFKFIFSAPVNNPGMYIFSKGFKEPMFLFKGFYIINPFDTHLHTILFSASMFLYPLTFCWIRKSLSIKFLLSVLVCTYLLMFNPFIASALGFLTNHVFVRKYFYGIFPLNTIMLSVIILTVLSIFKNIKDKYRPIQFSLRKHLKKNMLFYVFLFLLSTSLISYLYLYIKDASTFVYSDTTVAERHNLKIMLLGPVGFFSFMFVSLLIAAEYMFEFPSRALKRIISFDIDALRPKNSHISVIVALFLFLMSLTLFSIFRKGSISGEIFSVNDAVENYARGPIEFLNSSDGNYTILFEPRRDAFQSSSYGLKITALTPHCGVSMFDPTYKITKSESVDYKKRLEDARYVFGDESGYPKINDILKKYKVHFVFLEKKSHKRIEKMLKRQKAYNTVYEDKNVTILRTPHGKV